jgi:Concanavalin A-like lectin/glucanases superfamily
MSGIRKKVDILSEKVKDTIANVYQKVANKVPASRIQRIQNGLQYGINRIIQPISQMRTNLPMQSHDMFVQSNTMVAKFVFIVLALIAFVLFCTLGISLIAYIVNNNRQSPYIFYGCLDGNYPITITQNPKDKTSIPILRSNDRSNGIEFTWCSWLLFEANIASPDSNVVKYQNIFNKGDTYYDTATGVATVNNGPGLYLSSLVNNENVLHIIMDTVNPNEGPCIINVKDIPFRKWFHVSIRVRNKTLDVYINGTIASRNEMKSVPKQNYNEINLCQNGGFSGKISNLRYYGYALSALEVNSIVFQGPNLRSANSAIENSSANFSGYFSSKWFQQQL